MDKRGQGLTLNTIVIAALVIIVLIVLVLIFTGNLGNFVKQSNECRNQGGKCMAVCPADSEERIGITCPDVSGVAQKCCIGPGAL